MPYHIRTLTADDLATARELFLTFREDGDTDRPLPPDAYLRALLARDDFHVLAAVQDGVVIGGLTAYELPMYLEHTRELFLYEIGVEPPYRRAGVARALIEQLKARCADRGISFMYVATEPDNTPARRLYAATGGDEEAVAWFVYSTGT